MEPRNQTPRRNFTNIVYLGEGFHCRPAQCVQRTKTGGQDLGRLLSHLSDTKGEQETGKVVLLGTLNSVDQVFRGLWSQSLQFGNFIDPQGVKVSRRLQQTGVYQTLHHGRSQPFNIHGIPGCKMR